MAQTDNKVKRQQSANVKTVQESAIQKATTLFCKCTSWIKLGLKSMDWFLYDNGLHHERVKATIPNTVPIFDLWLLRPLVFLLAMER